MGLDAMIFVFWMLSFKPTFSLSKLNLAIAKLNQKKKENRKMVVNKLFTVKHIFQNLWKKFIVEIDT